MARAPGATRWRRGQVGATANAGTGAETSGVADHCYERTARNRRKTTRSLSRRAWPPPGREDPLRWNRFSNFWWALGGMIALFLAPPALVFGWDALDYARNQPSTLPFDSTTWIQDGGRSDVRFRMANDLIESHELIGKSREEVVVRLGPPDSEPDGRLQWGLGGPTRSVGGFQNILAVEFVAGRATNAFVFDD